MPEISFLSGLMTSTAAAATATSHTLSHTTDATLEPMLEHVCRTYFEDIQTAAIRHRFIHLSTAQTDFRKFQDSSSS